MARFAALLIPTAEARDTLRVGSTLHVEGRTFGDLAEAQAEIEAEFADVAAQRLPVVAAIVQLDGRSKIREFWTAAIPESAARRPNPASMAIAPVDTPWDADEARGRIEKLAKRAGRGKAWKVYSEAFAAPAPDDAQNDVDAYKLPIADVKGAKLVVVPRAVSAAQGALAGARGGVDLTPYQRAMAERTIKGLQARIEPERRGNPNDDIDIQSAVRTHYDKNVVVVLDPSERAFLVPRDAYGDRGGPDRKYSGPRMPLKGGRDAFYAAGYEPRDTAGPAEEAVRKEVVAAIQRASDAFAGKAGAPKKAASKKAAPKKAADTCDPTKEQARKAIEPVAKELDCTVDQLAKAAVRRPKRPKKAPEPKAAVPIPGPLEGVQVDTEAHVAPTMKKCKLSAAAASEAAEQVTVARIKAPTRSTVVLVSNSGRFIFASGANPAKLEAEGRKVDGFKTAIAIELPPLASATDDAFNEAAAVHFEKLAEEFCRPLVEKACKQILASAPSKPKAPKKAPTPKLDVLELTLKQATALAEALPSKAFKAPHFSATAKKLVEQAAEASGGVLFLDEAQAFAPDKIDALAVAIDEMQRAGTAPMVVVRYDDADTRPRYDGLSVDRRFRRQPGTRTGTEYEFLDDETVVVATASIPQFLADQYDGSGSWIQSVEAIDKIVLAPPTPKKAEPKKAEPKKAEPKKAEPKKAEPKSPSGPFNVTGAITFLDRRKGWLASSPTLKNPHATYNNAVRLYFKPNKSNAGPIYLDEGPKPFKLGNARSVGNVGEGLAAFKRLIEGIEQEAETPLEKAKRRARQLRAEAQRLADNTSGQQATIAQDIAWMASAAMEGLSMGGPPLKDITRREIETRYRAALTTAARVAGASLDAPLFGLTADAVAASYGKDRGQFLDAAFLIPDVLESVGIDWRKIPFRNVAAGGVQILTPREFDPTFYVLTRNRSTAEAFKGESKAAALDYAKFREQHEIIDSHGNITPVEPADGGASVPAPVRESADKRTLWIGRDFSDLQDVASDGYPADLFGTDPNAPAAEWAKAARAAGYKGGATYPSGGAKDPLALRELYVRLLKELAPEGISVELVPAAFKWTKDAWLAKQGKGRKTDEQRNAEQTARVLERASRAGITLPLTAKQRTVARRFVGKHTPADLKGGRGKAQNITVNSSFLGGDGGATNVRVYDLTDTQLLRLADTKGGAYHDGLEEIAKAGGAPKKAAPKKAAPKKAAAKKRWRIAYTDAPVDYDGFGTETVEVLADRTKKGPVRKVRIDPDHYEWQTMRYSSGNHPAMTPEKWEEIRDLIVVEPTTEAPAPAAPSPDPSASIAEAMKAAMAPPSPEEIAAVAAAVKAALKS